MAGRRRRTNGVKEHFWRGHMARQAAGPLSIRGYCAAHGLTEPSFYAWRREIARRDRRGRPPAARQEVPAGSVRPVERREQATRLPAARGPAPSAGGRVRFVPLKVRPGIAPPPIEIVLAAGTRVRVPQGADQATLATVLAAVGALDRSAAAGGAEPC